jgi:hypothetical protein
MNGRAPVERVVAVLGDGAIGVGAANEIAVSVVAVLPNVGQRVALPNLPVEGVVGKGGGVTVGVGLGQPVADGIITITGLNNFRRRPFVVMDQAATLL